MNLKDFSLFGDGKVSHYFKLICRKLWKEKTFAGISISGLAVGMACCILIILFVRDEISFNNFNLNRNNIYELNWTSKQPDGSSVTEATTPLPFAPTLAPKVAGIRAAARLCQRGGAMEASRNGERSRFEEQQVYFADSSIFSLFSMSFIQGPNGTVALASPNAVVMTDEMAMKYFGTSDAVGKTLLYENKQLLTVTGVIKKLPANSDLQADFLISLETLFSVENPRTANFIRNDWTFTPCYTFLLLNAGQKPTGIEKQLNTLLNKYGTDRNRQLNSVSLEPLPKIHLYASTIQSNLSTHSITFIYIFAAIGLLILFIANVNFINMAIAQSVSRSREVGMRKVLGANNKQLAAQFLAEALWISFFAFILALITSCFGLPLLNQFTGKQLSWHLIFGIKNLLLFASIFAVASILAGLYPAFFIARFKPVLSIKGKTGDRVRRNRVRRALLVAQFAISITLIIGAVIIYQQLQFLRNKPLGFQKHQVIAVPLFGSNASSISNGVDAAVRQRMNSFSIELSGNSKIKSVTSASELPGQNIVRGLVIPEGFAENSNVFVPWISVDYNFLQTLNIPIVAGRDFSKAVGTDHLNAFIINESAVHRFNWKNPGDAIGKNIIRGALANGKRGQIIGVIKDFNLMSLDQPIEPLILDVNVPRFTQFAITVQPDHLPQTVELIKHTWNKFFPERVFEYSFLDKDIDRLYADKENLARIIEYFALIAMCLSCSGLFSIVSFLLVQRTREIGIRKVLGANVVRILSLVSFEFVKLILIAFGIAVPLAWYVMRNWLQNFAFRIQMSWWVFAGAGLFVLLVALLTVWFQSLKAALANPIKSLRTE